ncbi:hypothetical protein V8G54_022826 [Vigna mungo]|uniref:Uncharacterized protein n=1 Tax=Vigna mungo TaxID=3915 RepID=A0AAQ3N3R4_VIGMU
MTCILHSTSSPSRNWSPSITFTSPSRSHLSILFFSVAAQGALRLRTRGFLTVAATASSLMTTIVPNQRGLKLSAVLLNYAMASTTPNVDLFDAYFRRADSKALVCPSMSLCSGEDWSPAETLEALKTRNGRECMHSVKPQLANLYL